MADERVTPGQEADPAGAFLTAAEQRWDTAENARWQDYPTALEHLSKALRSLADIPRLLRAVRVPLRLHHPLPAPDPQHPNRRVCDRCDQPWPCYEYEQIARALTGKDGT